MANDTDMTLMMRIKANANQARTELRMLKRDVGAAMGNDVGNQIGRGMRTGFGLAGKGTGFALAPLRAFGRAVAPVTAATMLLGGAAVKADADYEALQIRLEAVTGSATRAAAIFKTTEAFAASTPMRLDDLVDAQIVLEGIGVKGAAALRNTADAAAGMGRNVTDLAMAVASLETEPLRRLGIDLKRTGEQAEFTFRDKMGNLQKLSAVGMQGARETLLGIFDTKFGGTTTKLAGSVHGLASTLGDVIKRTFAAIGNGFQPETKRMLDGLIGSINGYVESGEAEALGKRIGEALDTGMDSALAAFKTLQEFRQFLSENPGTGAEAFRITASGMAEMFANSLIGYVGAMAGVFAGIGGIIWSAFEQQYLASAAGAPIRSKAARAEIDAMDYDQRQALFEKMRGWLEDQDLKALDQGASKHGKYQSMRDNVSRLTPQQIAEVATMSRTANFQRHLDQARSAIPDELAATAVLNKAVMARMGNELTGLGFDPAAAYSGHLQAVRNPAPAAVPPSYAAQSHMQVGDASGKPIIIQVGRLIVQATDSGDVARGIIAEAGRYGRLPMGAF
jgi:hypothetical protein